MSDPVDPAADLIRQLVKDKARCLCAGRQVRRDDRADWEQELFLRVWAKRSRYDPSRGAMRPFLLLLLNQAVSNLFRHQRSRRRGPRTIRSLNDPVVDLDRRIDRGDLVPESAAATRVEQTQPDPEHLALRMAEWLAELPADLRDVAERLMSRSQVRIARDLGLSRYAVAKCVRELRDRFDQAGLGDFF